MNELPSTFREMCGNAVARFLIKSDGTHANAEEIFNHSPTGELYMIFYWYEVAALIKLQRSELVKILYDSAVKGSSLEQATSITQKLDILLNTDVHNDQ